MKITRAGTTKTIYPAMLDLDLDGKADDSDKLDGKHASELGGGASNLTDQTSNRQSDTVYQNTTGKHLLVMVSAGGSGTHGKAIGYISEDNVNFVKTAHNQDSDSNSSTKNMFIAFVVPPNYYYKVIGQYYSSGWQNNIITWWEVEI